MDLSGTYRLRAEFLDVGPERFQEVLNHAAAEGEFGLLRTSEHRRKHPNTFPYPTGTIPACVPGDVIQALTAAGQMPEPLIGMNARDTAWLCDLSWWFIREFEVDEALLAEDEVVLFIELLDDKADLILNGIPMGHHANAFRPFEKEVKRYLRKGKNQLLIRLTSGTEDYAIQDSVSYYCCTDDGTKNQRAYLRKPQFTYGWDWCPSVPTCGIGGRVELQGRTGAAVTAFRADTICLSEKKATLELHFEINKTDMVCAEDAVLIYEICPDRENSWNKKGENPGDGRANSVSGKRELYLAGGLNFYEERVEIDDPKLWWPNGYGEAARYLVRASVLCRGICNEMKPVKIGIRTVELLQERIDEDQRRFDVAVNGVRIFCKGGNWVPPDSVYLRADRVKYRALLLEAKNLHFNMLRVWGGGRYEPDFFYEDCAELGILVMQDFMYSCAFYPDDLDWFRAEAAWEAEYQVRRLSHYPSVAIWTGNNEIAESWTDWWRDMLHSDYDYGRKIFNEIQPRIVKAWSPGTPYMPSTPYFGSFTKNVRNGKVEGMSRISRWGKRANNPLCGDVHAWNYFLNDPKTRYTPETVFETFDRFPARFCSEYGFWGPLTEASMRKSMGIPEKEKSEMRANAMEPEETEESDVSFSMEDPVWKYHGEKPEKREAIFEMIRAMFRDPENLSEREYLLYGGMTQGILYQELAEAMRIKEHGSGFLIWMFDDAWPETGWSVVDYYLTRKIAYYYLKRAFRPRIMILRREADQMVLTVINETQEPMKKNLEYGTMCFDGSRERQLGKRAVSLKAHERIRVNFSCPEEAADFFYVRDPEGELNPCTDLRPYYRRYALPKGGVEVLSVREEDGGMQVTLRAETLNPCVYLITENPDQRWDDNYFLMLPGEKRTVRTEESCRSVEVRTAGAES